MTKAAAGILAAGLAGGCGGGSGGSGDGTAVQGSGGSSSSAAANGRCTVPLSGRDWSVMSNSDLEGTLDTTNFNVSNVRSQIVYSGEGDCMGDSVDLTRVYLAKLDYEAYGESAKNAMDVAFFVNGDEYDRVFSLYLDTDNDASTGVRVTSGGKSIGADRVFRLDYQGRLNSALVNDGAVPERLKMRNDFVERAAGNIRGTGWYMMSGSGFADGYFTAGPVRAVVTVESFESVGSGSARKTTYLGLSDMTPVFTIEPF